MNENMDMHHRMADLRIEDEENESFVLDGDVEEEVNRFDLCLVGRLLTEKNVNVRALRSKIADVWKPSRGISIKEMNQGMFLFQFYRMEDVQWVLRGGPWTFDNATLDTIPPGENPAEVKLWFPNIWIQIRNLPMGFMMESVGKQLGNFFGEFLKYDTKNNSAIWREYMRILLSWT